MSTRENPYLATCPCCGGTICTQCLRYTEQYNIAADSYDCPRSVFHGLAYRRRQHMARYDHSTVSEERPEGIYIRFNSGIEQRAG